MKTPTVAQWRELYEQDLSAPPVKYGKTTAQLVVAPKGAVFIWPVEHAQYAAWLAQRLGRRDLTIKGPSWLNYPLNNGQVVILDHATRLTDRQFDTYCRLLTTQREIYGPDALERQVPRTLLGHGLFCGDPDRGPSGTGRLCDRHPAWAGYPWLERSAAGTPDELLREHLDRERTENEDRPLGVARREQRDRQGHAGGDFPRGGRII